MRKILLSLVQTVIITSFSYSMMESDKVDHKDSIETTYASHDKKTESKEEEQELEDYSEVVKNFTPKQLEEEYTSLLEQLDNEFMDLCMISNGMSPNTLSKIMADEYGNKYSHVHKLLGAAKQAAKKIFGFYPKKLVQYEKYFDNVPTKLIFGFFPRTFSNASPGLYTSNIINDAQHERWVYIYNKDIRTSNGKLSFLQIAINIYKKTWLWYFPTDTNLEATKLCARFYNIKKETISIDDLNFYTTLKEWFEFSKNCSEFLEQENISQ